MRICEEDRHLFLSSFGPSFLDALRFGDPEIINLLLQYYNPIEQNGFNPFIRYYVVKNGNIELFKRILPYIDVNREDFYIAIEKNNFELVDFIREQMMATGDDPLLHQDVVNVAYGYGLLDENKELLKYLVERGFHFDKDSEYIKDVLFDTSPEMIVYVNKLLNMPK